MFCRLIIWFEFIIVMHSCVGNYFNSEYEVGGEQQALNVQPSIAWDGDGGYVMFCLCMGEFIINHLKNRKSSTSQVGLVIKLLTY